MATHLLRQPKSLREVGRTANIPQRYMREAYEDLYTFRRRLLEDEDNWVEERHGDLERALALLPLPSELTVIEQDDDSDQ